MPARGDPPDPIRADWRERLTVHLCSAHLRVVVCAESPCVGRCQERVRVSPMVLLIFILEFFWGF